MNKIILILISLPCMLISQKTAYFETKCYFEDALGYKDTVTIGHDNDANNDYNPSFGEKDMQLIPWDNEFEVRGMHWQHDLNPPYKDVQSKKIIGSSGGYVNQYDCIPLAQHAIFAIRAKNYPVKISWRKEEFNNSWCRVASFIAAHPWVHGTEYWHEVPRLIELSSCLAVDSIFMYKGLNMEQKDLNFFMLDTLQSGAIDTMGGVMVDFRFKGIVDSPCDAEVVSSEDVHVLPYQRIYPNPTSDVINLPHEISEAKLFSQDGVCVLSSIKNSISIADLSAGIYFVEYKIKEQYYIEKIIKVE